MLNTPRMDREANRERMQGARELEEKFGRDFPDSFTFFALDAFGVVCASVLVVLGLWQVEQLIVMDARDGDRSSGRAGPNRQPGLRRAGHVRWRPGDCAHATDGVARESELHTRRPVQRSLSSSWNHQSSGRLIRHLSLKKLGRVGVSSTRLLCRVRSRRACDAVTVAANRGMVGRRAAKA
jgi:hypothetical protein